MTSIKEFMRRWGPWYFELVRKRSQKGRGFLMVRLHSGEARWTPWPEYEDFKPEAARLIELSEEQAMEETRFAKMVASYDINSEMVIVYFGPGDRAIATHRYRNNVPLTTPKEESHEIEEG